MTENTTPYYKKQASYQDKRYTINKSNLIEPIIRHRIQDSLLLQNMCITLEVQILQTDQVLLYRVYSDC